MNDGWMLGVTLMFAVATWLLIQVADWLQGDPQ